MVQTMTLVDIAKLHRLNGSTRAVADFFRSSGFGKAKDYLTARGVPDDEIFIKRQAHRSTPGVALVHPLVAMEYTRWVNYDIYSAIFLQHYEIHAMMVAKASKEVDAMVDEPHGGLNG